MTRYTTKIQQWIQTKINDIHDTDWYFYIKNSVYTQILFILMGILFVVYLFVPVISPYDPLITDIYNINQDISLDHWIGTDYLGRDILSRVLYGLHTSMTIAIISIVISFTIGVIVGCCAGYYGGWIDRVIVQIIDVFMAFPPIIIALALITLFGSGMNSMIIVFILSHWALFARLIRGQIISEKNADYILSARSVGFSGWWIMTKHLLPNSISPLIVFATLNIGHVILTISTLSFLGLGIPPEIPEWGSMIKSGMSYVRVAPMNVVAPVIAIVVVTLLFNLVGECIREMTNPKSKDKVNL
ncbi:MAG TPA: ABC transporter permease [Methanocorpusculum sp.]|nr:ABC transporter permease [Methanocorpusculum sp.]